MTVIDIELEESLLDEEYIKMLCTTESAPDLIARKSCHVFGGEKMTVSLKKLLQFYFDTCHLSSSAKCCCQTLRFKKIISSVKHSGT